MNGNVRPPLIGGFFFSVFLLCTTVLFGGFSYAVVHTGQVVHFSDRTAIPPPMEGNAFFGQDADYLENMPQYVDNGDGTITDRVTGLTWEQEMGEKMTLQQAQVKAKESRLGGYNDWRVPTLKELYSLILFTGQSGGEKAGKLFLDTRYFVQPLGNTANGEREIDAQTWSRTSYTGKTMRNMDTLFGVNFIDGRIKGYPTHDPRTRQPQQMYFRLVRGNVEYGKNNFVENGDGTVSDLSTGLMWQKEDSKQGMDWEQALQYAQQLELAGYDDWRLPSAKELQSIVDYTHSPQLDGLPAIDPLFQVSRIRDSGGNAPFPYFWSATTHLDGPSPGNRAVYIAFGEALGKMNGQILDVHGAGAQRSDPKSAGSLSYPRYMGPQGDELRVFNYVRCVRNIDQ